MATKLPAAPASDATATADDLAILHPDRTLTLGGRAITLREYGFFEGLDVADRAAAFIAEMMSGGRRVSFHRMAAKLNDAGFTTSTGRQFTAVQVRRLAMSNGLVAA